MRAIPKVDHSLFLAIFAAMILCVKSMPSNSTTLSSSPANVTSPESTDEDYGDCDMDAEEDDQGHRQGKQLDLNLTEGKNSTETQGNSTSPTEGPIFQTSSNQLKASAPTPSMTSHLSIFSFTTAGFLINRSLQNM